MIDDYEVSCAESRIDFFFDLLLVLGHVTSGRLIPKSYHLFGPQLFNRLIGITELAQDSIGMLAHEWRRQRRRFGEIAVSHRRADKLHLTGNWMLHIFNELEMTNLRVG